MKHKGPIITLAAGLIVAAVLMVVNLSVTKRDASNEAVDNTTETAATTPAATTPPATATPGATAAATQPPAVGTQVTYAGNVTGNAATLAIAIKDGKAVAYLCDGKTAEAWLQGTASGGQLNLTGTSDAKLTGTFGNGVAAGNVNAAGKQFAFNLKTVAPPSGLYRATADVRNAQLVGGWIVLENGQQVGLLQVGGTTRPAPPLNTATNSVTVDGTTVIAGPVDGSGL